MSFHGGYYISMLHILSREKEWALGRRVALDAGYPLATLRAAPQTLGRISNSNCFGGRGRGRTRAPPQMGICPRGATTEANEGNKVLFMFQSAPRARARGDTRTKQAMLSFSRFQSAPRARARGD